MSAREWEPGEVAMIEVPAEGCPHWHEGGPVAAVRYRYGWALLRDTDWFYDETDGRHDFRARPLVVIDPADREQVERLWDAWAENAPDHRLVQDNLQAALREFANPTPPKPDEPTNPAARVFCIVAGERTEWARVPGIPTGPQVDRVAEKPVWVNGWGGRRTWEQLTEAYDVEVVQP